MVVVKAETTSILPELRNRSHVPNKLAHTLFITKISFLKLVEEMSTGEIGGRRVQGLWRLLCQSGGSLALLALS